MNMAIKISIQKENIKDKSQADEWLNNFIDGCKRMDVVAIANLLDDDIIVNNQTKWEFLSYVRDRMDYMKEKGNKSLELRFEECQVCNQGCPVHFFKGINKTDWIAFYVDRKDSDLKDIVICNMPTGI